MVSLFNFLFSNSTRLVLAGNNRQRKEEMSSSAMNADGDGPDLVCQLDNVQGVVDALTSVRWKRHQVLLNLTQFVKNLYVSSKTPVLRVCD